MSILGAFNNVLTDFIDDCILVFPEDTDFKVYKKGVTLLVKVNPKKVLTVFTEYTSIYREKILVKEEDFFLNTDYTDIVSSNSKYSESDIFNIINKIKGYWVELNDSNKTKIWDYMILLINISDKYYSA
jgi:hypothetical protein